MSVPFYSSVTPPAIVRFDFGWIKQAWALFATQASVWVGAALLCFLINLGLWMLLALPTGELASLVAFFRNGFAASVSDRQMVSGSTIPHPQVFAEKQVFNILLAGIGAIFIGGLYRMALRQKRSEPISITGLFSAFPQGVPLFLVGIVVPTVLGLVQGACYWPLHHLWTSSETAVNQIELVLGTTLDGLLMFAPLLVVDAGASAPEALLGSVRLLGRHWLRGIGFYIAASFVGGAGLIVCGVGMLATYPVFLLSIMIAYLALTPPAGDEPPPFDPAPVGVWPPPPRIV